MAGHGNLPIRVIGGWGVDATMLAALTNDWPGPVTHLNLAGDLLTNLSPDASGVEAAARRLLARYPEPSLWLGWSLGAQIAMAAAGQAPDTVSGVVTLGGFPRFVQSGQCSPGMAAATFEAFARQFDDDRRRCWQRFLALMASDGQGRSDRRALRPWLQAGPPQSDDDLALTLGWLAGSDQTLLWQNLTMPALHLWGTQDQVVSAAMADQVLAANSRALLIEGMDHWPRDEAGQVCRQHLLTFAHSLQETVL
ncbi:alpha/beta fold hydrolase [Marinobacter xestospongiae]|uniref:Alpha/beta fold hydrolase n=1 Tax=Marinobacter xestospongiae TaxID=994319 RepID=A0ABU3VTX6_9GAMM|nr:alpha/beta fold hydrolase [Marinobacter xestospongiae]MDV2077730.1 alpha/beta fold hydrolase [Marinobacter xestospongiae]